MQNKYRKKPIVIEAVQFTRQNQQECIDFTSGELKNIKIPRCIDGVMTGEIKTLESGHGTHIATENDFIIKGVDGEFYPCKPDIFKKTYEKVVSKINYTKKSKEKAIELLTIAYDDLADIPFDKDDNLRYALAEGIVALEKGLKMD